MFELLKKPRQIFSSARNSEEAGSLTIVATALIETGSKMDELIFQEFKGTGNSEIIPLIEKIAELRLWPQLTWLRPGHVKKRTWWKRRHSKNFFPQACYVPMKTIDATETLIERMSKTSDNKEISRPYQTS